MNIDIYMSEMTVRYENYLRSDLGKMNLPNHKIDLTLSSISDHLCECDAFIRCVLIYNYDINSVVSNIKSISFQYISRLRELFMEAADIYCSQYKMSYGDWPSLKDNFHRTIQMMDLRLGGVSRERP